MTKRDRTQAFDWPRNEQQKHYRDCVARPSARNRGPKGRRGAGFASALRISFHITRDIALPPGSIVNGIRVPDGTMLQHVALTPPMFSRKAMLRALKRIARRHPDAYTLTFSRRRQVRELDKGESEDGTALAAAIVPPDTAPPGWWNCVAQPDDAGPRFNLRAMPMVAWAHVGQAVLRQCGNV